MKLGQFSASVTVGGVELSEYAPEYSADGIEATCWIASESDKQFSVEWKDEQASKPCLIVGYLNVDGIACPGKHMKLLPAKGRARGGNRVSAGHRDSVSTSETTRRALVFAKQALTDDDAYLNTSISPHLGSISLELWETERVLTERRQHTWAGLTLEPQILHERAKKAIGHSIQFGAEFNKHNGSNNTSRNYKTKRVRLLATFIFKYRPIDLLRAEGIAPPEARVGDKRPASPTDSQDLTLVDEDNDGGDANEIKQLEARLSELKKKNAKRVKREPSGVKKEIKSEGSLFETGEVIDLT
ncbi:hypothetical protein C8J57DRAFT_1198238 [Mycena rebaudengoi]|nr:hypothetical protein C8J57DRAFT_1198238 [Mycena rebaudengoi]